jgi:hypothetical protein
MSWHASTGLIDRYLADDLPSTDVMSVEAHLPECSKCQELVTRRVDRQRLAASWLEIERRLTAPVTRSAREADTMTDHPTSDTPPPRDSGPAQQIPRPPRRRRPQLLVAAAFLVTIVIVLGAVILSNEDDPAIADSDPTTTTEAVEDPTTTTAAAPSTTEPATPTTLPPPPPIEMSWSQASSQAAFGLNDAMWRVIEGGPGLLAVGSVDGGGGYTDGAVWASADGLAWERVGDPTEFRGVEDTTIGSDRNQVIMSIASGPGGYVAVGWVDRRAGDVDPAIWFSTDGMDWRRVRDTGPNDGRFPDFAVVIADGEGYLALGEQAWGSSDGLIWERVDDGAFDVLDDCWVACNAIPQSAVRSPSVTAFVVNGGTSSGSGPLGLAEPEVWMSADAGAWDRVSIADRPSWATGIALVGDSIVVTGYDADGATYWTSFDGGATWSRGASIAEANRDVFPTPLVVADDVWLVGAFDVHGPPTTGQAVASAVVFASNDDGARWQELFTRSHSEEGVYLEGIDYRPAGIRHLIGFGDRLIAVGSTGNGSSPVWIGTWE